MVSHQFRNKSKGRTRTSLTKLTDNLFVRKEGLWCLTDDRFLVYAFEIVVEFSQGGNEEWLMAVSYIFIRIKNKLR